MKHLARSVLFGLVIWAGVAPAQVSQTAPDLKPTGKGWGEAAATPGTKSRSGTNGTFYHGGALIFGTANVYYIWYGDWSGNTAQTILDDFASNIGGSPYFNINATYHDATGVSVNNSVLLHSDQFDNYSHGKQLSDADVEAIVAAHNPVDENGVYFVLTSADVAETSGFCAQYCGWHRHGNINGLDVKFAFVGNPDRCPSACEAQASSPNGNAGADAMASVIAHELSESITDPDFDAWYDGRGLESGDKCEWNFGAAYVAGNGSWANVRLGARDYLLQQIWVNDSGGYCALAYPSAVTSPGHSGGRQVPGTDGTSPWPLKRPKGVQPSGTDGTNPWPLALKKK